MVSFTTIATAVAAVFAVSSAPVATADDSLLPVGTYYRPKGSIVSGVTGATTPYRRSPCPAINTLANHGYLPRNGQNITSAGLKDAIMTHFNVDDGLATFLTSFVPATFDLDLLGKHGFIEHDASLVHADAYFGGDPAFADGALLEDFFSRASRSEPYTIQTLGEVRRDRLNECKQINPNCTFDSQGAFLAFGEASLLLKLFGDGVTDTAPLYNVRSFLAEEKFPTGYQKPALLSQAALLNTSALIQAVANA